MLLTAGKEALRVVPLGAGPRSGVYPQSSIIGKKRSPELWDSYRIGPGPSEILEKSHGSKMLLLATYPRTVGYDVAVPRGGAALEHPSPPPRGGAAPNFDTLNFREFVFSTHLGE